MEPKSVPKVNESIMQMFRDPELVKTNNPYHVPTKKEKLKVVSSKLKERLSMKVKRIFEDKKKGANG